jgi:hypothetical protein
MPNVAKKESAMKTMSRVQSRTAAIFFALRLSQMSKKNGVCKAGGRSYRRAPGNPAAILSALGFMVLLVFAASHPDTGHAAFPGVNGKIAFTTNRDGNLEIYVMNANGSSQTNLTNNPASDSQPMWSPDGTRIVFQSNRHQALGEIYTTNADGSDVTRLTTNAAQDARAAWQPLPTISVEIDIKPGSFPNSINLRNKGVVPVAILGTSDFNVDDVDVSTVEFAGAMPVRFSFEDVNLDGHVDLVFHFRTQDLQLTTSSTQATLTGETTGGVPITGTDSVRIVK